MADGGGAGNHHLAMNTVELKTTRTNLTNFIFKQRGIYCIQFHLCKVQKQVKVIKDVTSQVTLELVDPKVAQGGFPDAELICF